MKRMNRADWVLCIVASLFFLCLAVKIKYPELWLARAAFFTAEAALVGGIADWFAVTALFRKPLGFPYHTALLPRERKKFIHACVNMVQSEFFAKRRVLTQIKHMRVHEQLLEWFINQQGKTAMVAFFVNLAEQMMDRSDKDKIAASLEKNLLMLLSTDRQSAFYGLIIQWNRRDGIDEALCDQLLIKAREKLAEAKTTEAIELFLRNYIAQKTPGVWGGILQLLAEAANVVNFAEAAVIIQHQLLHLCEKLFDRDNPVRRQLIWQLETKLAELVDDAAWQNMMERLITDLYGCLDLRGEIKKGLLAAFSVLKRPICAKEEKAIVVISPLVDMLAHQMDILGEMLQNDLKLQEQLDNFICEVLCRSALEAQAMVGVVVEEALRELSEEELNKLVYGKVEQDMIWLRMNGSIVGGGIGAILFGIMELFR